jgi:hypothetical protein
MDREAEAALLRDLDAAGEAQVRAEFYGGGGLSTGGEDKRKTAQSTSSSMTYSLLSPRTFAMALLACRSPFKALLTEARLMPCRFAKAT